MKNVLILLLLANLATGGCSREDNSVNTPTPVPETPDASIVVANCATLQAAVEQFAGENDGVYPENVDADTSLAGNTVIELLPAGDFENPFTGSPSAPVNGVAGNPGEVGYVPVAEGDWNVGYVVTGFGADSLVATLSNLGSPEEAKVIANCFIVRQAAEEMFDNNHKYPYEIDCRYWWHLNLANPLVNPYTGLAQYPPGRTARSPGEIGYVAILQNDVPIGYVVTGYGAGSVIFTLSNLGYSREEAIIASDCRTLQRSVEEYPDTHGGLYPGTAACVPGVAYETIQISGWNIGYRITGSAQGSEFIEMATSPQEARVRLNCLLLKQAVEESAAQNEGLYPETVDKDRIPGGSVIDLLPRAHLLENPYTGSRESPVNHSATRPGEIGYAAIPEYRPRDGRYVPPGYVITGFLNDIRQVVVTNLAIGAIDAIVMSHCRTVQLAVEKFAARNNGIYPDGTSWGMDLYGETLTDLLPREALLINPATWAATEPIDGWATNAGEIGYVPYHWHGESRGYSITGVGTEAGTTIMDIFKEWSLSSAR
ncbi:MAG: hypothetical protein WC674_04080 [Candidatus Krumholzibacteriia bacterium]